MVQVSAAQDEQSQFAKEVEKKACVNFTNVDLGGCLVKVANFVFHDIPAFFLWFAAIIFNFFINITLYTTLYFNDFIPQAWSVVRDLSNIFFILILLYVAIQTILGFGHEIKKVIVHVVVMALLINFSMFFTKIVIDSSNVLALVFYNKINVETTVNGQQRPYSSVSGEKDVSGGLVSAFDPTKSLNEDVFNKAKQVWKDGKLIKTETTVPTGTLLSLILISGFIMYFAIYAFFIAGLSFVGRLIELWILIIFSPFAFMSFVIPKLSGLKYLGWNAWLHRLLATSFMAPIFMFFLYLIFKLVHAKLFENIVQQNNGENGLVATLLGVMIPALIIMALLKKATDFAKEGGGQFGEMAISGAKLAAGLAVGGAALGVAAVGRGTAGAVVKSVQSSKTSRESAYKFQSFRDNWSKGGAWNKIKAIGSLNEGVGKAATAGVAELIHKIPTGIGGKTLGEHIKTQDEGYQHKTHATHILDAKMKQEYGHAYPEGAKFKDLKEKEQKDVIEQVDLDEMAKFAYNKKFADLEALQGKNIKEHYKKGVRAVADEHGKTVGIEDDPKKVKDSTGKVIGREFKGDYFARIAKTSPAIGEFVQALRKGTYDIRNLPDMSAKSKGFLPQFGVGLIAKVAAGVRLGMKKGGGVEYGTPKGDYIDDVKNTLSEALKNVKINISESGGGHGGSDHGVKEVKSVGH